MSIDAFTRVESQVRSYCRAFPAVFSRAVDSHLYDDAGNSYIDFFSGAGTLNYGHNNPELVDAILRYLRAGGIVHSLDMYTEAKAQFLEAFERIVLKPRNMPHKLQFTGPTGTNTIEAALKLARKVTGRHAVATFSGGYHGMSLGALAITANSNKRNTMGVQVPGTMRLPYDGALMGDVGEQLAMLERMLTAPGYGLDMPAAFVLEVVQGEGGLNCASSAWLVGVEALARRLGALLIVDDIQAGCGRVENFFSFESSGISPDIVCVSKSLSGFGLPFALCLVKPEHDVWEPGEHNGTFRGNNLAMITATATLERFWTTGDLAGALRRKAARLRAGLAEPARLFEGKVTAVGRGFMQGLRFADPQMAKAVSRDLFAAGMVIETCGPQSEVLKCLPALTIDDDLLSTGTELLVEHANRHLDRASSAAAPRRSPRDVKAHVGREEAVSA